MIYHWPIHNVPLHQGRQFRNRRITYRHDPEFPETYAGAAVRIAWAVQELWPGLSNDNCVNGELFPVAMECELEAIGYTAAHK